MCKPYLSVVLTQECEIVYFPLYLESRRSVMKEDDALDVLTNKNVRLSSLLNGAAAQADRR